MLYLGGRALVRDAMRVALARAGYSVVAASALQQALDQIAEQDLRVVIVDDDQLGEAGALDAVTTLLRVNAGMRCAVLSASRSAVYPADVVRAGASAYLSKEMSLPEFRIALERIESGDLVVDPTVMRSLLGILGPEAVQPDGAGRPYLTGVERRVLALASDGRANKQIAAALGLSPLTVKNHIARIRRRLGAADKAQAVAIALRGGLLD